ncbi:hypothetical protein KHA80_02265 [Anaerobacillus sp. HL2]|nr:hypothetical protein KHA80_02265 [Anaerobacillus sp. HL2]
MFLKKLEEVCFSLSDKVTSVNHCGLSSVQSEIMIANTKGLEKREKSKCCRSFCISYCKEQRGYQKWWKVEVNKKFFKF